ncbi:MAG: ATP-dependent RNA helicase DbpA [Gammaproteobacteria bacterium]
MNAPDFSALGLAPGLFENLRALGYETMTPIQAQSLPSIMAGKDVIAQGSTGTGKTAAFGLGLLSRIDAKLFRVQAMVLCPTRELADQVANEIRALARSIPNIKVLTLCGGTPLAPQASSLQHGVHVVVGTPGRIEDHLQRETLPLQAVHTLILDEADRMLDMGFQEAIDAIIRQVPGRRQTLLFSATYPPQIQAIARRIMLDPVMVRTQARGDNPDIEQHFFALGGDRERLSALCRILLHYQPDSALVFCNTIKATRELCAALVEFGFHALALHGDLEQRERDETLIQFANKSISILVATDVAARGLDIDTLDAVVNYEIARDPDVYLHRIGRTGRAGSKGQAYALYTDKEMASLALIPGDIDPLADAEQLPPKQVLDNGVMKPAFATLQIDGGRKHKLRPGDILGALTATGGVAGDDVGKIKIADNVAFVAVKRAVLGPALRQLAEGHLKGRSFRVRQLGI